MHPMHPSLLVFLGILGLHNLQTCISASCAVLKEAGSCSFLQNDRGQNLGEGSSANWCQHTSASEPFIRILAPLNGSVVGRAATLAIRAGVGDRLGLTIQINGLEWLEMNIGKGDRIFRLPESLRQGWHFLGVGVESFAEAAKTSHCASLSIK
eukprot:2426743-Rhodomonas_salina.1